MVVADPLQEIQYDLARGGHDVITQMSADRKRKIYHRLVLAIAIAIPTTINALGFILGWWEQLVTSTS